ncbi:BnaC04g28660D [Brassica napus]|uniref:BnaC04g28660D protein n=2 Tax=Brassica TaxID=3705 RepID=A0A078FEH5_BRANA|nr:BnaC04g28660D [Brassica napus]VDD10540.1 unnamed protein product [Brassica oleracea]
MSVSLSPCAIATQSVYETKKWTEFGFSREYNTQSVLTPLGKPADECAFRCGLRKKSNRRSCKLIAYFVLLFLIMYYIIR